MNYQFGFQMDYKLLLTLLTYFQSESETWEGEEEWSKPLNDVIWRHVSEFYNACWRREGFTWSVEFWDQGAHPLELLIHNSLSQGFYKRDSNKNKGRDIKE